MRFEHRVQRKPSIVSIVHEASGNQECDDSISGVYRYAHPESHQVTHVKLGGFRRIVSKKSKAQPRMAIKAIST